MFHRRAVLTLILAVLTAGCSDDDSNKTDTGVPDTGTDGSGQLVTISGDVYDSESQQPAGAVKVSVDGTSRSTTTGSDGNFSLQVPAGAALTLRFFKASYMTTLDTLVPPAAGLSSLEIPIVPPRAIDDLVTQAGLPTRDPQKGVVMVDMLDAKGGESATLGAGNDGSLTFDVGGAAIQSDKIVAGAQETTLIFINVATGTTTVTPTGGCTLRYPGATDHLAEAGALTTVTVECP